MQAPPFFVDYNGGNGEYTFSWHYIDKSSGEQKLFTQLLIEVDDTAKELQFTESAYNKLLKYASDIVCSIKSADGPDSYSKAIP